MTGHKLRCGRFDAVMVRQGIETEGIDGIALTKLDVLDESAESKICTGFRYRGETLTRFPSGQTAQAEVKAVYETFPGWQTSTCGARSWAQLPAAAVKYVRRLE